MDKEFKEYEDEITEKIKVGKNELEEISKENEDSIQKEKLYDNEDSIIREDIKTKIRLSKKSKYIIFIIFILMLLVPVYIKNTVSKYENKIFPGTLVYNQDISDLNKYEFLDTVKNIEKEINKNKLQINIEEKIYDIEINNLVSKYNNEKLYESIINSQKEKNILSKFISIVSKKSKNYNLQIESDEKNIKNFINEIAQDINIECIEASVIITDNKISYKEGKDGLKLDEEVLFNDIKKIINSKNLNKENIIIEGKLISDKPKISMDDLKSINYKVSQYTTTYVSGNTRGSNIENAASKIDNLLLMPGEEFSYENTVGPVIESNGYKYAPVISNGKLVNGIGGGICQVSSTLYNTQLNAGILPTERRNHSKAVNYVPRGLDATLASGIIDYKFKNTYKYPLVINTKTINGNLTIEIWSNENVLQGIEYKPVSYVRGNIANTYLYGYDKEGNKVYEEHIDTSIYR